MCLHWVCRDVEDLLFWLVTKRSKFIVKSLYNVLEPNPGGSFDSFPIGGIWISWVSPKCFFFFFVGSNMG